MFSLGTVEPDTLELLKNISSLDVMSEMRLVGGTSLALQLGHRRSVDLDFFGTLNVEQDELDTILKSLGNVARIKSSKTMRIYQINGVKVDFVDYRRYGWIAKLIVDNGICLASIEDIAAMKINAIEGRGTKKDFVDIFILLRKYTLSEILEFYKQKYPDNSCFRALMSLTYFEDAEHQPMPFMFENISWEDIKQTIVKEVDTFSKDIAYLQDISKPKHIT